MPARKRGFRAFPMGNLGAEAITSANGIDVRPNPAGLVRQTTIETLRAGQLAAWNFIANNTCYGYVDIDGQHLAARARFSGRDVAFTADRGEINLARPSRRGPDHACLVVGWSQSNADRDGINQAPESFDVIVDSFEYIEAENPDNFDGQHRHDIVQIESFFAMHSDRIFEEHQTILELIRHLHERSIDQTTEEEVDFLAIFDNRSLDNLSDTSTEIDDEEFNIEM